MFSCAKNTHKFSVIGVFRDNQCTFIIKYRTPQFILIFTKTNLSTLLILSHSSFEHKNGTVVKHITHLPCQQSLLPVPGSMPKHIFNKNSITLGSILYKHMGDCTDDFPILNNGAAAHSLYNPSSQI